MRTPFLFSGLLSGLAVILTLGACGKIKSEAKYPTGIDRAAVGTNDIYEDAPSIFGGGGLLSQGKDDNANNSGGGIPVNSYLWRAALETTSFMPLSNADPFGGTIITDWYTAPETPNERIRTNILILSKQLKASGIKATVFKQVKKGAEWTDAAVGEDTARKLEDAILTRARQLRIEQLAEK
jgi:hypothetical protein